MADQPLQTAQEYLEALVVLADAHAAHTAGLLDDQDVADVTLATDQAFERWEKDFVELDKKTPPDKGGRSR
jgi:hypothetical protein